MQPTDPVFGWYRPATQSVQLDTAPAEILPASQLVHAVADAAEYLPKGHAVITERPAVPQNDPAVHAVHELCPADASN